jgi:hypothetical protein
LWIQITHVFVIATTPWSSSISDKCCMCVGLVNGARAWNFWRFGQWCESLKFVIVFSALVSSIVPTILGLCKGSSEVDFKPGTKWRGATGRSNAQTVTLKPVSAELLVVEDPSAGGWAGNLQQIGYAIASAWSYHVSPDPGW